MLRWSRLSELRRSWLAVGEVIQNTLSRYKREFTDLVALYFLLCTHDGREEQHWIWSYLVLEHFPSSSENMQALNPALNLSHETCLEFSCNWCILRIQLLRSYWDFGLRSTSARSEILEVIMKESVVTEHIYWVLSSGRQTLCLWTTPLNFHCVPFCQKLMILWQSDCWLIVTKYKVDSAISTIWPKVWDIHTWTWLTCKTYVQWHMKDLVCKLIYWIIIGRCTRDFLYHTYSCIE